MLLGGFTAVGLGQDVNYDLHNYHFYNPWAFLNGVNPLENNIAVGGILSYENPTRDIPAYLLMDNLSPKKAGFIIGALQAINIWLVFEIVLLLLGRLKVNKLLKVFTAFGVGILTFLGSGFLSELGTTMGDNTTSVFVLASVFLLLLSYQRRFVWKNIDVYRVLAFVFAGASAGLKLTNLAFVIGLIVADFVVGIKSPLIDMIKRTLLNGTSILTGLIVTAGYWFTKMWVMFGNPIFPFYNAIFKSDYYPAENFVDDRWVNAPIWQSILEPFAYLKNQAISSEMYFADPRLAFMLSGILLLLLISALRVKTKVKSLDDQLLSPKELSALVVFILVSYLFWAVQFSYYRYIIALELLSIVTIFVSLIVLTRDFMKSLALFSVIGVTTLLVTVHTSWGRVPWQSTNFGVSRSDFSHLQNSTVLIAGSVPFSFLVPYFPETTDTVRVGSNMNTPSYGTQKMRDTLREAVERSRGNNHSTYALITDEERKSAEETFQFYGFVIMSCEEIPVTTRMHIESKYRLCRVEDL